MLARDVMTRDVVTVGPETSVRDIARQLVTSRISAVPVVDDGGQLVGLVSEGDLMRRPETGAERHPSWWLRLLAEPETSARDYVKSHGLSARDVMTRDVVTIAEDASLEDVATLLEGHRIKRVPVIRDGKIVGIVSRANLLHGLVARGPVKAPSLDDRALRDALDKAVAETGIRKEFINIVVNDGVVRLWGAVETNAEKQALRVAAEGTPGVTGVEDHVGVLPQMVRAVIWAE
ncbi:CBS domain-containing protein [Microbaculum marinisediminis]|uniref:CBS domain-containing protein n=1 Tax=Microbaculum marinisediminis TaxID=2931392 RepID=A0AAW5R3H4_9HYPH|nr:CBS domain-containing protein [Microbaculum sp. A6E488]MCT8973692.1 CBS domain-containing protein [Microbaculum sp. A6E488]